MVKFIIYIIPAVQFFFYFLTLAAANKFPQKYIYSSCILFYNFSPLILPSNFTNWVSPTSESASPVDDLLTTQYQCSPSYQFISRQSTIWLVSVVAKRSSIQWGNDKGLGEEKNNKNKQKTVLPGKDFGLLAIDSLQHWELNWLAAGWAMEVIIQDKLNNAPTWRQKHSR